MSSYLRHTIALARAQVEYRRSSTIVVLLVVLSLLVMAGLTVKSDNAEVLVGLSALLSLFGGAALGVFGWGVEAAERRVQMQVTFPTSRAAVSSSRFLATLVLHLIVMAAVVPLVQLPVLWGVGTFGQGLLEAFCGVAWGLVLVYGSFVTEEINVALASSKLALYAANAVMLVVAYLVVTRVIQAFHFFSWQGLVVALATALALAVVGVVLFARRSDFRVGVSPWHGFPVDWSSAE